AEAGARAALGVRPRREDRASRGRPFAQRRGSDENRRVGLAATEARRAGAARDRDPDPGVAEARVVDELPRRLLEMLEWRRLDSERACAGAEALEVLPQPRHPARVGAERLEHAGPQQQAVVSG